MRRATWQNAAEYTSEISSSQEPLQPGVTRDPGPPAVSSPAPLQNRILGVLPMEDQDSPLDLTLRKPPEDPCGQDAVLDLSTKSLRGISTSQSKSACSSTVPAVKGLNLAKAQDLQSTSTLEQFMAKLCLHHQQQIVDALGFLQTEVKAIGAPPRAQDHVDSSPASQRHNEVSGIGLLAGTNIKGANDERGPASMMGPKSLVPEQATQAAGVQGSSSGSCPQQKHSDALDLCGVCSDVGGDSSSPDIIKSHEQGDGIRNDGSVAAEENVNSVGLVEVNVSSASHPINGTLEERQCNPNTPSCSSRGDSDPETLDSTLARHDQGFCHLRCTGQTGSSGHTKDFPAGLHPVQVISRTSCTTSPRKARKSRRGLCSLVRNFPIYRVTNDSDSHYDIVYISRPVTECEVCPQPHLPPRQNARKSTRGHTHVDERWELKTVRTLALKSKDGENGNWPAPMPVTNTLVTPVQVPCKPDGVPPVDILLTGSCEEAVGQNEPADEPAEIQTAERDSAAFSEPDRTGESSRKGCTRDEEQTCTPAAGHRDTEREQQEASDLTSIAAICKGGDVERSRNPEERENTCPLQLDAVQCEAAMTAGIAVPDVTLAEDGPDDSTEAKTLSREDRLVNPLPDENPLEDASLVIEREQGVDKITGELERQGTESACQATCDTLTSESEAVRPREPEPLAGMANETVTEDSTSVVEQFEKEDSLKDAAIVTSESVSTRKLNGGDVASLDRCLRSSKKASFSVRPSQTPQKKLDSLEVSVSENPKRTLSHRTVCVKWSEEPGHHYSGVLRSSSEVKANVVQVEGAIQTRRKHKLTVTKGEVKDSGIQVGTAFPSLPTESGTETESPKVVGDSKEKRGTVSRNDCPTADAKVPGAMEMCGKMQLRKDGDTGKSLSSTTPGETNLGSQWPNEKTRVDRRLKTRLKRRVPSSKDTDPFGLYKMELLGTNPHKFVDSLKREENQPLIASLNNKYDKMQRGWIQIDRAGQQTTGRPKNRSDRLKEIWKSKRKVRKVRCADRPRCSPVHMLFMKTFDLSSICRWFLQTTETKSLVIVKKVNTRLSSETQLCFHGSSGVPGSSHGIFPSLQAERLKKHLKKFAVASPVKSNPKNQKLISKAWEQGASCSKGRDKTTEFTGANGTCANPRGRERPKQTVESQKTAVRSPASARILRKYSNIREKLQVQQRALAHKEVLQKLTPKLKPTAEQREKPRFSGRSQEAKRRSAASVSDRLVEKVITKEMRAKKKPSATPSKKNCDELKRCAKVGGTPSSCPPGSSRSRKQTAILPKAGQSQAKEVKVSQKKAPRRSVPGTGLSQHMAECKPSISQDQVMTRSQRKTEKTPASSTTSKCATKRTLGFAATAAPAKRTRTSLLK